MANMYFGAKFPSEVAINIIDLQYQIKVSEKSFKFHEIHKDIKKVMRHRIYLASNPISGPKHIISWITRRLCIVRVLHME